MIRFLFGGFRLDFTFLFAATVTFCLLTDETGLSTLAFSACILHEGGHLLLFALTGVTPQAMIFELCGIRLVPPLNKPPFFKELLIQSGGVLMNGLLGTLSLASGDPTAAAVHLLLAGFSLLPLKTLDGGQILRLLLEQFLPPRFWCIADWIDVLTTFLISAFCLYLLCSGRYPLTLLVFSGGLLGSLSLVLFRHLFKRRSKL